LLLPLAAAASAAAVWTQAVTNKIRCVDCDLGSQTGPYRGAFFKVRRVLNT